MVKKLLSEKDIYDLKATNNIGIVATKTPDNFPHISLITTIQAKTPQELILGEFCKGISKKISVKHMILHLL